MTLNDQVPTHLCNSWSQSSARIVIATLLVALLVITGWNALDVLSHSNFHEELRILYHYDPARTNTKDYTGQYLSSFPQPFLYVCLTKGALIAGVDLILFHKLLTIACVVLMLVGGALAGLRIGGAVAAVAVAVLLAAQPIYQFQINSATPHAFAFPLLIWGLASLLYDRPYGLAVVTVLSGLLYPAISPVLGFALAWHLLIARKALSAQNAQRIADVLVLSVTGAISLFLLWQQLAPTEGFGASVAAGAKADVYPENGPGGRHFYGVFNPMAYVFVSAFGQFRQLLSPEIIIVLMMCFIGLVGYGFYRLRERQDLFRLILSFIIPSAIICVLIAVLRPTQSYRFLMYPLFTILPVLFVGGLLMLCNTYRAQLRYPAVAFAVVMAVFVISLNSTDAKRNGFKLQLDDASTRLMAFVRSLPQDSLLAAWPGPPSLTSLIPYVAGRPLLVTYKAHYPSSEGYISEMRARMYDLMDAYLASDFKPLHHLQCRWQVDYVVVDRTHFAGSETAPEYFAPFDKRIAEIFTTTKQSQMVLKNPPASAVVFEAGDFSVVDLALLSKGADCPPQQ